MLNKKKINNLLGINLYFLLTINLNSTIYGARITYELSGGRLGDNLIAYCHAKWLSFKHDIPLLYKSFKYSDQLAMHYVEDHLKLPEMGKKVLLKKNLDIDKNSHSIYSVPYFGEDITEHRKNSHWVYFKVDWENSDFKYLIQKSITPINTQLNDINLPKDCNTVAVHIRRGGGYDQPLSTSNTKATYYADLDFPLKFPPISFYIDQIKKISESFENSKLYVYIFTDDQNPEILVSKIKEHFTDYNNIIFDFRKENNKHDKNVLEDFFAITQFDCLIRSQSNFSFMASKISNYKLEIYPVDYIVTNGNLIINKIKIASKDKPIIEFETNFFVNKIPKKVIQQNKKVVYKKKKNKRPRK